jgi:hypothetical protein
VQVSKDPLQVYIDGITGALKYTKIGWLPPNAIAISFYHTGNNPLGLVDPSPSYLSWPSTQGGSFFGSPWVLCPLGSTQQYQVFINSENFGIGGVSIPSTTLQARKDANTTPIARRCCQGPRLLRLSQPCRRQRQSLEAGDQPCSLLPSSALPWLRTIEELASALQHVSLPAVKQHCSRSLLLVVYFLTFPP